MSRWLTVALLLTISVSAAEKDRLAGLAELGNLCDTPQIGMFGEVTTIIAHGNIFYRTGEGPWTKSPMEFSGHSLARLPNGRWLMNDSRNNRVIQVDDLSGKGRVMRSELAGFALTYPHDQIVDPKTGDIYVIDSNRRLFRFKDLEGRIEAWTFTPDQMGYDRSMSWFDGYLHVIVSGRGEVIRIENYAERRFTAFRSPRTGRKNAKPFLSYDERDFMGGALSTTGLILNDVDKAGEWYYGANEFTPEFAFGGDTHPARLIRWRTWADFEQGRWEDLSSYIPQSDIPYVPYFLTIHNNVLYAPLFKHRGDTCEDGKILRLDLASLPTQ